MRLVQAAQEWGVQFWGYCCGLGETRVGVWAEGPS